MTRAPDWSSCSADSTAYGSASVPVFHGGTCPSSADRGAGATTCSAGGSRTALAPHPHPGSRHCPTRGAPSRRTCASTPRCAAPISTRQGPANRATNRGNHRAACSPGPEIAAGDARAAGSRSSCIWPSSKVSSPSRSWSRPPARRLAAVEPGLEKVRVPRIGWGRATRPRGQRARLPRETCIPAPSPIGTSPSSLTRPATPSPASPRSGRHVLGGGRARAPGSCSSSTSTAAEPSQACRPPAYRRAEPG